MIRIDEQSAGRVRLSLARSAVRGADPVRALDELGLLSYPAKIEEGNRRLLRNAAELIEDLTPTQLGGDKIPATAADMKRCIVKYIKHLAEEDRNGQ